MIFPDQRQQIVRKRRIPELAGGQVDFYAIDSPELRFPVLKQAAYFLKYIKAYSVDPAVFFPRCESVPPD